MTPKEIQEMWMKKLNYMWFHKDRDFYFKDGSKDEFNWPWVHQGQGPMILHFDMFTTSVDIFSNEEQRSKWMPLVRNMDILGCYAQTEIGHGSDVSS